MAGDVEREVTIDASVETVFRVISDPLHIIGWWPDVATYEPRAGAVGEIAFVSQDGTKVEGFQVVQVVPPRLFSFRWGQPPGVQARPDNSLLVTFRLSRTSTGTLLTMTETGFDDRGWQGTIRDEVRRDHLRGWDYFLPRIVPYASRLTSGAVQ